MFQATKESIITTVHKAIAEAYELGKRHKYDEMDKKLQTFIKQAKTDERLKWADRLTNLGIEQHYAVLEWTAQSMREDTWLDNDKEILHRKGKLEQFNTTG